MSDRLLIEPGNLVGGAVPIIVPARSGLMTVIAADADVYCCLNLGARPLAITMLRVRWHTSTAFASAQCMALRFHKLYGMTAVHSGGSPVAVQAHYRSGLAIPNVAAGDRVALTQISTLIAGTAAMTSPTFASGFTNGLIQDSEPEFAPVASGSTLPALYEDWQPRDGFPLVLEPNTALLGKLDLTMGATGVGRLKIALDSFWI